MKCAIGVDVGGTNMKLAVVDEAGTIHLHHSVPTPQPADPVEWVDDVGQSVSAFIDRSRAEHYDIEGIGFTVPHFYDGPDWVQLQTNSIRALEGFPLYQPLRDIFGPSIGIVNDLSAAGIAEHMFGKGRDAERMLLMAIGTGIATSVVTQDGLVQYSWGTTGDTGMIIVDPDGLADCTCGGRGCLETVAAAPAIRARALKEVKRGKATLLAEMLEEKGDLEARDVSIAANAGDAVARDIMDQAGHYLGVGLTSLLHIFNPTVIVLGGGVALAGDLLLEPIKRTMARLASPWYMARLESIEISALGKNGGVIGAATVILYPGRYLRESDSTRRETRP
jgi:glucokinase-like ROK family protein